MSISKKNKRRVNVDGKEYLWWVFEEYDQTVFDGIQVKIVSVDQSHFLKYGLEQSEHNRKIVFAWKNYSKLVHLSCPLKFENEDGIITNSGICRLIKWSKTGEHHVQYALIGKNNNLTVDQKKLLLSELKQL